MLRVLNIMKIRESVREVLYKLIEDDFLYFCLCWVNSISYFIFIIFRK